MDQPRLLTRDELIAQRGLFEARSKRALLGLGISAIPMAFMFCVIAMTAPETGAAPVESPLWLRWLAGIALASVGVGAVWFIFSLSRMELQFRCPSCQTAIGNPTTLLPVMACSRCLKCEQVIVGTTDSVFEPRIEDHPLPTYERLESRRTLWTTVRWGVAGFSWCVVTKLLLDHWTSEIKSSVGEVVFPFVRVLVFTPGIVIAHWGLVRACRSIDARADKCPQCRESINGQIAALTGCCGYCGNVVRLDRVAAVEETAIAGSWKLAEFQRLTQDLRESIDRHINRLMMIAFPILFALLVAMKLVGEKLSTVLMFVVFGWTLRKMWQADQMGKQVHCPHCTQPQLRHRAWVIASRRCGGCGMRIIAEEPVVSVD